MAASKNTDMADAERADGYSTASDESACEEPSDHRAATSPIDTSLAYSGHVVDLESDQVSASDDNSATSSIAAAVLTVGDATRRTTSSTIRLQSALVKAASALHAAIDAYASVVILSYHINDNHPSKVVRARRLSDHIAAVHI